MRQKANKSIWRYSVIVILMVGVLIVGTLAVNDYFTNKIRMDFEKQIQQQKEMIQNNTRKVYVAIREISAGEQINHSMVELQDVLCTQDEGLLFTEEDIGKETVTDVSQGTYLLKSLVNHSGRVEGLREVCYQAIQLTESTENYDVVDIRIRYPNGEDYIVLSGKKIRLDNERFDKCYLQLDEREILMMSAAMYDTEVYHGTTLYTSRYLEPGIQTKSIVTYLPGAEMRELMIESPNVFGMVSESVQERKNLEARLEMKKKEMFYD